MFFEDPVLFSLGTIFGQPVVITPWTLIGFVGNNVLFSLRVLVQWIASEKARKCVAPRSFWWISLSASLIMILYTLQRSTDPRFVESASAVPFLIGFVFTLVPYTRNLLISYKAPQKLHMLSYVFSAGIFMVCLFLIIQMDVPIVRTRWFILGMIGSLIWYTRYIWQWLYSERKKESAFPLLFWYVSLCGITLNTIYAVMMRDIVFILGFLFNVVPIIRNIMLIKHAHRHAHSENKDQVCSPPEI